MTMGMLKQWREAREQREAEEWKFDEQAEEAARAEGYRDVLHKKASHKKKHQRVRWGRRGRVGRQGR